MIRYIRPIILGSLTVGLMFAQAPPPPAAAGAKPAGGPRGNRPPRPQTPTPRLPNGKPDFAGDGIWNTPYVTNMALPQWNGGKNIEAEIPYQPWAKAIFAERVKTQAADDPEGMCLPPGIPRMYYTPYPFQIIQEPNRWTFIFEGGAHIWRTIKIGDNLKHPEDPNPNWLGDAIGHWEGDTLVVDTVGFNDRSWLDFAGHPHTDKLHVVERFSRPFKETMVYSATIDDPGAYTGSWTVPTVNIPWTEGGELIEYICQENNRDQAHLHDIPKQ